MKKRIIPTGKYIYLHSLTLNGDNVNLYCTNEDEEILTLSYDKKSCQVLLDFLIIKDLSYSKLMIELDEPLKIEIAREVYFGQGE